MDTEKDEELTTALTIAVRSAQIVPPKITIIHAVSDKLLIFFASPSNKLMRSENEAKFRSY